jgi:hypothetical protein
MADAVKDFASWNEEKLASYLKDKAGLGDYYELLIQHKVTGEVAPRLSDLDLKEMGISNIGDRKMFAKALEDLQKEHRKQEREKVIWQGEEVLYFSCWDRCMDTCCGCSPVDPAEYKLTGTHLVIKRIHPCRFGPIRCCCAHEYEVDNIDLTHVADADVRGVPAPCVQQICCCGVPQDHIEIKTTVEGQKILVLPQGEGEVIARKITNQVEEAQKIERD